MPWHTIDEFTHYLAEWTRVQVRLQELGAQRPASTELVEFGTPSFDGHVLTIPNGPGREISPEGAPVLTITREVDDTYTLRRTGRYRDTTFSGQALHLFSNFELAGKLFLAKYNTAFQNRIRIPRTIQQWGDGSAPGWTSSQDATDTSRTGGSILYSRQEDGAFFFGGALDDSYTYPLSMDYQKLSDTFLADVPRDALVP